MKMEIGIYDEGPEPKTFEDLFENNTQSLGIGILTDEAAGSSHGQPVLEFDGKIYGPGDVQPSWRFTDRGLGDAIADSADSFLNFKLSAEDKEKIALFRRWEKAIFNFRNPSWVRNQTLTDKEIQSRSKKKSLSNKK